MYLDNLFGASSYLSPYQWGTSPTANANTINSANAAPVISAQAPTPVGASNNTDQVSLSSAAQALQAQNATAAGSQSGATTDFTQEQQMLTTLTDKSLAALGIISTADEANTQISFNSLSYQVSSSAAAAVGQQGQQTIAALGASQDATFDGQGTIVTPDGTHYTFQISLELDQSAVAASTSGASGTTSDASDTSNSGADAVGSNNVGNTAQQQPSNLLAQLVNAIGFPSASPITSPTNSSSLQNSQSDSSTGSANGLGASGSSTSASSGINWDAILKQTASLFDLLDSLIAPTAASSQAADQTSTQTSAQPSAQSLAQAPIAA